MARGGRPEYETEALYQGRALREQKAVEKEKALQRAVRDVLDGEGGLSAEQVAKFRRVPAQALRERVKAARLAGAS